MPISNLVIRSVLATLLAAACASVQAVTFKVATLSPEGSVWMKELRQAAEEIARSTEQRVTFKIYPGGVMGDDKAVLRKIRVGQLHGAVLTAGGLTQTYTDIQLYNLPMVFADYDEIDYVRERMDPVLLDGLAQNGFIGLGISEVGFAYAMSKVPVFSVSEARAEKVWVPDGDLGAARALASFGISPIPLSIADVLGGLQTGLINGVAVPPVAAIALQWHTQLENVLDLPLLYVYGLFAISDRQFGKLTAADQTLVREHMLAAVARVSARSRADHNSAVAVMKDLGIHWNRASPEQVAEWQSYAVQASERLAQDGFVTPALYQTLLKHLSDYRRSLE